MLDLLSFSPIIFVLFVVIFVMSISVHEFAHAFAADKLGDPTPRHMGRLTLNPLAHLDPLGTLLIILIRVGWGKPVQINPTNFKNPRRDSAIVAFSGPLSNILLALFFTLLLRVLPLAQLTTAFLYILVAFNLGLAFFNLLPVFPLDGFSVVYGLLPLNLAWQWEQLRRYGIYILLILMVTGSIGFFVFPLVDFSLQLLGF